MLRCKSLKIAEIEINGVKLSSTFEILQYIGKQEERIAELEKENELFKKVNEIIAQQRNDRDTDIAELEEKNENLLEKLITAKDILRRLMASQPTPSSMYEEADLADWREVNKEAKQFFK